MTNESLFIGDLKQLAGRLQGKIVATPVREWDSIFHPDLFGPLGKVFFKQELFQKTGSFKLRGAYSFFYSLSDEQLAKGVTAVSAGNHAVAVSYVAHDYKVSAKVVMPSTASKHRIALCRQLGAEVLLVQDIQAAFTEVERIQSEEDRVLVHPFESPAITLGTATLGAEILEQVPNVEAIVLPVGGGGLASGVARIAKMLKPECAVYGVEPKGARTLAVSIEQGKATRLSKVDTIADGLGAPYTLPYSFKLCQCNINKMVAVSDEQICAAMALLFQAMKLVVEPSGAAAFAGALWPLREQLRNKVVTIVLSGGNADPDTFCHHLRRGEGLLSQLDL